ncbi:MAG TPA: hypothetical protein DCZ95_04645 [Verrucomicrobia bacterium]|nr:MAG: hypothetical protein A2X46_14555 [Lentisphaerae bacterium GWF2_57_35]HBA83366.1 hypothetical protein [Verrucomicrobiota bacterium]
MDFTDFTSKEWHAEVATGFPLMRSLPASCVQAFLAVTMEQNRDPDFLVSFAQQGLTRDESFWADVMQKMTMPRFMGFREAQRLIGHEHDPQFGPVLKDYIEEARALTSGLVIPSAKEMRKHLFPLLTHTFSTRPENFGGGNWRFSIQHNRSALWLHLDFGGMHSGFRWYLDLRGTAFQHAQGFWIAYEGLMGMGQPHWDQISTQNLEASGNLLCSLVKKTLDQIK